MSPSLLAPVSKYIYLNWLAIALIREEGGRGKWRGKVAGRGKDAEMDLSFLLWPAVALQWSRGREVVMVRLAITLWQGGEGTCLWTLWHAVTIWQGKRGKW